MNPGHSALHAIEKLLLGGKNIFILASGVNPTFLVVVKLQLVDVVYIANIFHIHTFRHEKN